MNALNNTRRHRLTAMAATLVILAGAYETHAGVAPSFQGLGAGSVANGVPADGSVVVGSRSIAPIFGGARTDAFLWQGGTITDLGVTPTGGTASASAISADGLTVVGSSDTSSGRRGFRWRTGTGVVALGALSGGSAALDVSDDGLKIVGFGGPVNVPFPAMWQNGSANGSFLLGNSGGPVGKAQAISADGSKVIGNADNLLFLWDNGTVTNPVDPASFGGSFNAISADGSTVVGDRIFPAFGAGASRWTPQSGELVNLGDLAGGGFGSRALGVSADGSVIVGFGNSALGQEAFVWNADDGMRSLQDVLVNSLGLDLTGWSLTRANAISDDGLTIAGAGVNPAGDSEGWIATIPEPGTFSLLAFGGLVLLRRRW